MIYYTQYQHNLYRSTEMKHKELILISTLIASAIMLTACSDSKNDETTASASVSETTTEATEASESSEEETTTTTTEEETTSEATTEETTTEATTTTEETTEETTAAPETETQAPETAAPAPELTAEIANSYAGQPFSNLSSVYGSGYSWMEDNGCLEDGGDLAIATYGNVNIQCMRQNGGDWIIQAAW